LSTLPFRYVYSKKARTKARIALEKFDIAIIGGGVAGLSTALHICKEIDATLVLVDKRVVGDPKKTSPFTFPDVAERFNLLDAVLQKYTRFTYRSPTGVAVSFEYENPAFVTLDYQKMCNIMLNQIKKECNATVLEETEALNLEIGKAFFSTANLKLTLSNSTTVSCNILVDASGKDLFASTKLGVKIPTLYSHAYGEFLRKCQIEDPKEMCIFAGKKYGNGGGWMYPIDRNTARFGFATVTSSPVYPRDIVEGSFREAIRDFFPYNKMLAGAERIRSNFGTIPIGPIKKFVYGKILIVGDAAGQATPWYNEGIRPALESGKMCGESLAEAYKRGKFSKKTLKRYQCLWDAKNRKSYFRATKIRARTYLRTQEQWDNSVSSQASLTPDEMIARIRYDKWPNLRVQRADRHFALRGRRNTGLCETFKGNVVIICGKGMKS